MASSPENACFFYYIVLVDILASIRCLMRLVEEWRVNYHQNDDNSSMICWEACGGLVGLRRISPKVNDNRCFILTAAATEARIRPSADNQCAMEPRRHPFSFFRFFRRATQAASEQ